MPAGLTAILYGMARDDLPRAIGGLALTVTALTIIGLLVIRRWVTDTRDERRFLAATQRQAEAERATYVAAKAALVSEQGRLLQDVAAERAALTARLATEREAMQEEFDRARGEISADAMEQLASWITGGKVRPPDRPKNNLIRFPKQQPETHPQQERSREHGAVRP